MTGEEDFGHSYKIMLDISDEKKLRGGFMCFDLGGVTFGGNGGFAGGIDVGISFEGVGSIFPIRRDSNSTYGGFLLDQHFRDNPIVINVNLSNFSFANRHGDKTPTFVSDNTVRGYENDIIKCLQLRAKEIDGKHRQILDKIESNIPSIDVKDARIKGAMGQVGAKVGNGIGDAIFNGSAVITMNRAAIIDVAKAAAAGGGAVANTVTTRKEFYILFYASTFIHELCHISEYPESHPGAEDEQFVNTPAYYKTVMGGCDKSAFRVAFGQISPDFRAAHRIYRYSSIKNACLRNIISKVPNL